MGTAARMKHREEIMGHPDLSMDFPLHILLARDVIDREMCTAGMKFGDVYVRVFGAPHASGPAWASMYHSPGVEAISSGPTEGRDFRAEAEYAHSLRTLDALPNRILSRQLMHQLGAYLVHDWYVRDVFIRQATSDRHRRRTNIVRMALLALSNMDPVRIADIAENPLGISGKSEPDIRQRVA